MADDAAGKPAAALARLEAGPDPRAGTPSLTVPRWAMHWMSYELAEALAKLSQQQMAAIFRIVQVGHLVDEPVAPYSLIRGAPGGPPPICSETVWKRPGKQREDGSWVQRPGWSHQPEFLAALKLAKRLARQQMTVQAMNGIDRGVGFLQSNMPLAALRLLELSTGKLFAEDGELKLNEAGEPVVIDVDHRSQIAASKIVIDVALAQAAAARERAAETDADAVAWWDAAEEG